MANLYYKKFSEIQHLLPPESYEIWCDELDSSFNDCYDKLLESQNLSTPDTLEPVSPNADEFKNKTCLFIEGDWESTELNLDEIQDEQGNDIFLIVVSGNMKFKNIYCENIDSATGLIVLGSLEAQNMLVCGQQIYVCNDLVVKECFWGDYMEGYLVVTGTITVEVLICTNHYGFGFEQLQEDDRVSINYYLWDDEDEEQGFPRLKIADLITADCLFKESDLDEELYSWDNWLNKAKMIEYIKSGSSILNIQN